MRNIFISSQTFKVPWNRVRCVEYLASWILPASVGTSAWAYGFQYETELQRKFIGPSRGLQELDMPWETAQVRLFIPSLGDRGQEVIWPFMLNDWKTLVCICCSERWWRQNKYCNNCRIGPWRSISLAHSYQGTWTIIIRICCSLH